MLASYSRADAIPAILDLLAELSEGLRHIYIAIDGLSGTGKTTFAAALAEKLDAVVIHIDDFYLPLKERHGDRIALPGWNVDYERFAREVARPFLDGKLPRYGLFHCGTQSVSDYVSLPESRYYIIEGSYAMHPEIPDFYDLRIVLCGDREKCRARILDRDGEEMLKRFDAEWLPLEEAYFDAYMIRELADVVVDCDGEPTDSDFGGFTLDLPFEKT